MRLGKKEPNRNRPLLVALPTIMDKREFMASLYKLKHASEGFNSLSITHDLTKEERQERRNLVREAKRKQEEETSNPREFRIRGPPGNLRIVWTVKSAYKLLVGDLNFGSICWEDGIATSTTESTFVNTLQDTYMTQHVAEPTRGRNGQEPSILDLMISNDPNIVSYISYESPLGKSGLTFYLKCYRNKPDQTRKFYPYDKGDFKQMNADLVNINWDKEIGHLADPSSAYAAFSEIMLAPIDKHVPTKTLYPSRKHKNCSGKISSDQLRRNTEPGKGTWKLAPGKST